MRETTASGPTGGMSAWGRSPLHWAAVGLIILLVAVGVFVWQQSGGGGGPLNAVAKAAETTEHEPGGHAAVYAIITAPDGKKTVMTGTMAFDDAGRVRGVFSFPNPKTGGRLKMQMVGGGGHLYMSSSLFGSLPGGAKWMGLDLSSGEASASPVPTTGDAEEGLKLLEAADNVEELGKEDVRGVPTTRYRGTTGPTDKPMHVEVWIDGDGRVVRMRLVNSPSGTGEEASSKIDMRTDFFNFGPVPPINVPDPSEVFDATALGET